MESETLGDKVRHFLIGMCLGGAIVGVLVNGIWQRSYYANQAKVLVNEYEQKILWSDRQKRNIRETEVLDVNDDNMPDLLFDNALYIQTDKGFVPVDDFYKRQMSAELSTLEKSSEEAREKIEQKYCQIAKDVKKKLGEQK